MTEKIVPYRELHEKVQDHVAKFLRSAMNKTFDVLSTIRDYKQMLETVNPDIRFYIDETGKKVFDVLDKEERLSAIMGASLAMAAKWDKRIMDKVVNHMLR